MQWNTPSPADQLTFPPDMVFEAGLRHHHIANTAYPIHHQTTMRPYRVPRKGVGATAMAAWQEIDTLSLYVHVPFCAARCKYCEYTVVDRSENEAEDAYFDALLREFDLYRERLDTPRKRLVGFDIGGGTPSLVKAANIRRVVEAARSAFRFQPGVAISIEIIKQRPGGWYVQGEVHFNIVVIIISQRQAVINYDVVAVHPTRVGSAIPGTNLAEDIINLIEVGPVKRCAGLTGRARVYPPVVFIA